MATIQNDIDSAIAPYAESNIPKFMQFGYMNTTAAQSIGLSGACYINVYFTGAALVLVEFVNIGTLNEINFMKKVTTWGTTFQPSINASVKQEYYGNSTFTWNYNLVDSTKSNTATIVRFGAVCILNFQCQIRATPDTSQGNGDIILYTPSTFTPYTTARAAIIANGADTVVSYCGYGSWNEGNVTKYGLYIGSPHEKVYGKYCFGEVVFMLLNNN